MPAPNDVGYWIFGGLAALATITTLTSFVERKSNKRLREAILDAGILRRLKRTEVALRSAHNHLGAPRDALHAQTVLKLQVAAIKNFLRREFGDKRALDLEIVEPPRIADDSMPKAEEEDTDPRVA